MPTNVRFQVCQVSAAAQGSFAQKVLLRLGKPESVLWHHLRYLWRARLPVYATPVVVGGRLRGDAWCGMQLSTPQFRGVLHKPRIGIVPDPFLVKAVWLRETTRNVVWRRELFVFQVISSSSSSSSSISPLSVPSFLSSSFPPSPAGRG